MHALQDLAKNAGRDDWTSIEDVDVPLRQRHLGHYSLISCFSSNLLSKLMRAGGSQNKRISLCDELTATFDPTMRFKRSNSNLENFHDVFGVAAFSLLLAPWRDIS